MRILIVEDDRKMARILTAGLRAEGHATDLAQTGEAAIALLARAPYQAVILDVMLPGRDGLEVCRTLRAAGNGVGVLMLTARDAVPDRVAGLDAGADDYLWRPGARSGAPSDLARRGSGGAHLPRVRPPRGLSAAPRRGAHAHPPARAGLGRALRRALQPDRGLRGSSSAQARASRTALAAAHRPRGGLRP